MTEYTPNWNDVWAAMQELGAALRPVFDCKGAPPEWATKLGDALDQADEPVTALALGEDEW